MSEKRKYTKNIDDLEPVILKMLEQKMKKCDIAKELNVSLPTLCKVFKKNNVLAFTDVYEVERKILELYANKISVNEICKIVNRSRSRVFKVLKKNRVPEVEIKKYKKNKNINELISTRLFYFCNDYELLSKRLATEILYQKPEKIIVPKRLQSIVQKEKINKVVNILERINIKCNLEYAN